MKAYTRDNSSPVSILKHTSKVITLKKAKDILNRILPLLFLIFFSCSNNKPKLYDFIDNRKGELILNDINIDGKRVDDRTKVELKIYHSNNKYIYLDLEFYYNPFPQLVNGMWSSSKSWYQGNILSNSLKFSGGQGEPPSVGGNFYLLDSTKDTLFHLFLPLMMIYDPLDKL